ncbi:TetR family transcriptional regulator [Rhodococcus sp. ABRD24]|uniref:TetR/AcrR family transcriptional regulator n=1 Tax=Rhodococcus sp. ABRD24 TaxID=2507582 RepID=UPI0010400263|nr:TetR/AcrR family transcriptional regulator [Rhodococcus sp. ABRD24]QBJ96292.1 TetR family transcriptional regulator [Rhodococcus sp. ABRD24]
MPRPSVEAERREQILQATCEAIAELGFRDVRISDVSRRAGVSNGTVHYYFDSKDALLHAAFQFNFENSLDRRAWIMEKSDGPLVRLHRLVESYLPAGPETVTAWRVWVELWASALGDAELQKLNDNVYGEWRAVVYDTVEAGIDQGVLRAEDPGVATDMLLGLLDGLAIQVLTGSAHMTPTRMRAICDQFIDAITVGRAV